MSRVLKLLFENSSLVLFENSLWSYLHITVNIKLNYQNKIERIKNCSEIGVNHTEKNVGGNFHHSYEKRLTVQDL